ncbi:hypothetical protein, partial [Chitinophaga sp. GbtcB8]|uniref:hypothetical protein n=1 Tax=Chitinophaga sp. GbtcB8 TaxID=2824753 RepID=UPI001C2F3CE0
GLKDMVNRDVNFFCVAHSGVDDYLKSRQLRAAEPTGDENIPFNMDSISVKGLQGSFKLYMIKGALNREQMNRQGELYDC